MSTNLLERYLTLMPMTHYAHLQTVRVHDPELAAVMRGFLDRIMPQTVDLEAQRQEREHGPA